MTPREEILEALIEELRSLQQLHEYEVGPEDAALAVSRARLNEILATYELVPIDNTPFDPERCGWKLVCMIPVGYHKDRDGRLHYSIIQQEEDGKMKIESMDGEEWVCPWPANHSDGVRLLQLLGLEIKE